MLQGIPASNRRIFGRDVLPVSKYSFTPTTDAFSGPIVLLVGHGTISRAETFSTMLVDAGRVHVIGRQSASTNGNITHVQLPGAFGFRFTGMDVRHADAGHSQFHALGIQPEDGDVVIVPSDLRAGVDPEIEAAVDWLTNN